MGSCWMGDHSKSSKASSWMEDEIKRRIPLNHLFICLSIVPNWVFIQLTFYIPPNLPRALGKGAVSSGTFVLAPFLTICFFFYKLYRISTKLGQNHQWVKGYKSYQQFDLKGQIGVTGVKYVKKSFFYGKCYSSYMLHSRVTWLRYINKLETLYKTYWLKSRFWVIWGHRGQKFIFTKNASPHTIYIVWSRDLCI